MITKADIAVFVAFGNTCVVPSYGGGKSMLEVSVTEDQAWSDYWDDEWMEQRPWTQGEQEARVCPFTNCLVKYCACGLCK